MVLSQQEINLLFRFSQVPFLPVAMDDGTSLPVYSDDDLDFSSSCGEAILGLAQKGLISLDFDLPLTNYDYAAYEQYPQRGSMALTAKGQDTLDLMEYQSFKA